ncbi:pyridoxamine 5'-phosphate oxidase family protein [Novosphingobium resinovorum]|uniref:pyridoxamine 5'-phosphate oxidase family protein n=1 Tax=Novosphingobium resinovorum TaxID=158500 RepID=UPI002ED03AFA|nr:pyridoxamine 5'-phosphate oxidase family protein [Novosphingobium resinovorum]
MSAIDSMAALEDVVGKTPPAMHLKVIDHLDAGALHWISRSPLAFVGAGRADGLAVTLAGGSAGFAAGDTGELRLPLAMLDDPDLFAPGMPVGTLLLLPGVGETLRVNGRVSGIDGGVVRIAVEECYGHCAKAMIRSGFWTTGACEAPDKPAPFAAAARFMALATMGALGWADLSPKGDPAGGMARLDGDVLWFADRPGNRRVDSFRNIVEQPRVACALLVPGSASVARVRGHARLTTEQGMREGFAVNGKIPQLAIGVTIDALDIRESAALACAALWPVTAPEEIDTTRLFVNHIKLNRSGGIGGAIARASIALPGMTGLMKKGLDKDYKDNLY